MNRSSTNGDSAIGSMLSHKKITASQLTRDAGLPSPEHKLSRSVDDAIQASQLFGWPIVVKPADSDRGEGVTVDIANIEMLKNAFEKAKRCESGDGS